jgi:hypothetical protein
MAGLLASALVDVPVLALAAGAAGCVSAGGLGAAAA